MATSAHRLAVVVAGAAAAAVTCAAAGGGGACTCIWRGDHRSDLGGRTGSDGSQALTGTGIASQMSVHFVRVGRLAVCGVEALKIDRGLARGVKAFDASKTEVGICTFCAGAVGSATLLGGKAASG